MIVACNNSKCINAKDINYLKMAQKNGQQTAEHLKKGAKIL